MHKNISYRSSLKSSYLFLLIFFFISTLTACREDDEELIVPVDKDAEINNWIYETMKDIYLWTDKIPDNVSTSLDPADYFQALKYSNDRFSVLVEDYQELMNSLSGINTEAGYEFMLARINGESEDVAAIILYVKENSPAKDANLLRGDIITHINGQKLTISNYKIKLKEIKSSHSIRYKRFNKNAGSFEAQPELSLNAVVLSENPNFIHKVITSQTGKKVGYFVYNFFSSGTNNSTEYDEETRRIFAEFKNAGVDEMIIDLRYNSGGTLTSAVNLASLLGKNIDETRIFSENIYNNRYQEHIESLPNDDSFRRRFINLPENIGDQLSSQKIYILTGSGTASASELIINGLMPYMDVHIIGEKTVGKNVGSIPVEDKKNEDNSYGMLPIIFKIYNSAGESNYSNGFLPQAEDQVKDLQLPLEPLGDVDEPLLARTMEIIDGVTSSGRFGIAKEKIEYTVEPIMSSLETKTRSNRIILD
jgi:carboxyl-terminal processing protease